MNSEKENKELGIDQENYQKDEMDEDMVKNDKKKKQKEKKKKKKKDMESVLQATRDKKDGDNDEFAIDTRTESMKVDNQKETGTFEIDALKANEVQPGMELMESVQLNSKSEEENDEMNDTKDSSAEDTDDDDILSMLIAMQNKKYNEEHEQQILPSDEPINSDQPKLSFFTDSKSFVKEASPYPYITTTALIVFLHVIYFLQWKRRTVKHQVQFSYKTFIVKRKYHLMYWSYLSHVPLHASEYELQNNTVIADGERETSPLLPTSTTAPVTRASHTFRSRVQERFINIVSRIWRRLVRAIPLLHTIQMLTCLPQLTYISHLLWQIRSLEEFMYRKDKSYIGLIMFAMISCTVLKSWLMWVMLQILRDRIGEGRRNASLISFMDTDSSQIVNSLGRGQINQIGSSSFTSIICSLLVIYMAILPQVPLQVLPFVPFLQLPANELGFMFCLLILMLFETKFGSTSRTGIWVGLINGMLIANGMDSFYTGNGAYWFHCIIGISCTLCVFSIWVEQRQRLRDRGNNRLNIPCIDYIGWDEEGRNQELKDYEAIWRDGVMNGIVQRYENQEEATRSDTEENEDFNFNALVDADRRSLTDMSVDLESGEEGNFISWNSDVSGSSNRGSNVTHRGPNQSRNDSENSTYIFGENRRNL